MLDLELIKQRLAAATPGPWKWREWAFRHKYMHRLKNGRWRAKPGKRADLSWVMLLTGPLRKISGGQIEDPPENIIGGYPDEWDYPHIIAIRWNQIKAKALFNATPTDADAELIANAPTDIAALINEIERLRNKSEEE